MMDEELKSLYDRFDRKSRRQPIIDRNRTFHSKGKEIRKFLEKRDGKRCFVCWAKTSSCVVHHSYELSPSKSPYEDPHNPEFQCLLCLSCHTKIHQIGDRDSPLMRAYKQECQRIISEYEEHQKSSKEKGVNKLFNNLEQK